jgi:hypothetical protein
MYNWGDSAKIKRGSAYRCWRTSRGSASDWNNVNQTKIPMYIRSRNAQFVIFPGGSHRRVPFCGD